MCARLPVGWFVLVGRLVVPFLVVISEAHDKRRLSNKNREVEVLEVSFGAGALFSKPNIIATR